MTKRLFSYDNKNKQYLCEGDWSIHCIELLSTEFKSLPKPADTQVIFNGEHLTQLDSAAALFLSDCIREYQKHGQTVVLKAFSDKQHDLLALIDSKHETITYHPAPVRQDGFLEHIGKQTIQKINQMSGLVVLIGDLTDKLYRASRSWGRFQFPSIVSNILSAGLTALPIVGLLSFLIGIVLAYQMGLQLETYGATIFIAYLSGMAVFREFAPLITAIIIAGRTSSAFTAQIGSMKINEEIDALYTMGLSPTELIVVPKVLGLLFIFPLLIFWSDFFGILGAMLMSRFRLHVGYEDYLIRLQDSVGLKQLMLGLYKAPTFALLIALVGCFQGFRVEANADSVGRQTTRSVVQALFLIIIADAAYSIVYNWMGL